MQNWYKLSFCPVIYLKKKPFNLLDRNIANSFRKFSKWKFKYFACITFCVFSFNILTFYSIFNIYIIIFGYTCYRGPRWQSGNTLASHLCGRGSIPVMAVSGKAGSCLPLVGSLQYTTLANYMYWFPLPFQLPVVI